MHHRLRSVQVQRKEAQQSVVLSLVLFCHKTLDAKTVQILPKKVNDPSETAVTETPRTRMHMTSVEKAATVLAETIEYKVGQRLGKLVSAVKERRKNTYYEHLLKTEPKRSKPLLEDEYTKNSVNLLYPVTVIKENKLTGSPPQKLSYHITRNEAQNLYQTKIQKSTSVSAVSARSKEKSRTIVNPKIQVFLSLQNYSQFSNARWQIQSYG